MSVFRIHAFFASMSVCMSVMSGGSTDGRSVRYGGARDGALPAFNRAPAVPVAPRPRCVTDSDPSSNDSDPSSNGASRRAACGVEAEDRRGARPCEARSTARPCGTEARSQAVRRRGLDAQPRQSK